MLGDVRPGACVISAGNVVVLGALRGTAISGGDGRAGSFVAALEMTPQKLKIGDFKYTAKEKKEEAFPWFLFPGIREAAETDRQNPEDGIRIHPKLAYVEQDRIVCRTIYE